MAGETDSGITVVRAAFYDARFGTLARVCGLADADHARGKIERLWNQLLEEHATSLTRDDVETVLGDRAVEGLIRSRLGRELDDGRIYLAGTATGKRVTWLGEVRQQASAAGQASAKGRARDERGRLLPRGVTNDPNGTPSETPAPGESAGPAPSNDGPTVTNPLSLSSSSTPVPESLVRTEGLGWFVGYAVERLNFHRSEIDSDHKPINPVAISGQHTKQLLDHLRPIAGEERLAELDRRIDVLAAKAKHENKLGLLSVGELAGPQRWGQLGDSRVSDFQRAGPPGRSRGSAPPAAEHGTEAIDPKTVDPWSKPS